MAQKHSIDYTEYPMTRDGRIQGPSRRYRRLRHPIFPAATWTAKNPLLQRGEIGAESDTYRMKIGDGVTYWNDLPYSSDSIATWGDIQGDIADQTDLQNALDAKQDVLTAGSNIQIDSDNVISATDTTYTASDGVTLTGTNFTNSGVRAVASGTANGTISVNTNGTSVDVAVTGLGSAAYTSSSDYATAAQGGKADTAVQPGDLATVATTGSYNDLLNKPTIPAAQVNSDWDAVSGVAQILNKPSLATVATSGDYDDLLNKPTIPTVNNATLTIQKNGTTVNTFTANASSNVTANITVPTKISDLTNDSNFANTDLSNLTSTGANIGNWSNNVTNCITEIPQDINLTLSNGTLTLKAGSKLYKPNGAGVFDEIITENDMSVTNTSNGTFMVFISSATSGLSQRNITRCVSGTTRPLTTTYMVWYDTTNNVLNNYGSDSSTVSLTFAFPVCIITVSGGAISSIDQVFNGFGYIGSTVFALPGIKGLIPNGRNADGTLKNAILTTDSVLTLAVGTGTSTDTLRITNTLLQRGTINYNSEFNYNHIGIYSPSNIRYVAIMGSVSYVSGQITSLSPKYAFRAVDYSDTEYMAHQAMPSGRYVNLTLGTSGATYTMPADGYLCLRKNSNAANQTIRIRGNKTGSTATAPSSAFDLVCSLQVEKGETVQVSYDVGGDTTWFNFVYANGAK